MTSGLKRAALLLSLLAGPGAAFGQTTTGDAIGDLLHRKSPPAAQGAPAPQAKGPEAPPATPPDPRAGDPAYEQAIRLMAAINAILEDTAKNRGELRKLPSKDEFIVPPIFTETREDRERKIRDLIDAALGIVTDVPVVELQKKVEERRKAIRDLDDLIVKMKERQLAAPKDGMLPGVLSETVDSLGHDIDEAKKKIELNRAEIKSLRGQIEEAMKKAGVQLTADQLDLLLDSVLSGDLVRLVAVFNSAKAIDAQLGRLMAGAADNMNAARKYFAMHAALFAMLVQAQDSLIAKIDQSYLPKLDAIAKDVASAREQTNELLKAENRPDQVKALQANRDSQKIADDAARAYRRYLLQQREQVASARKRAAHDLRIADNTFETVEASVQLRALMKDSAQSFEALQRLEAPTFDQIFRNEELRREFELLTRKLDQPTS